MFCSGSACGDYRADALTIHGSNWTRGGAPAPLSCCPVRASSGGAMVRPVFQEEVMRSRIAVVGLVLAIGAYPAVRMAADDKPDRPGAKALIERIQDLNLTDEQEAKIADIQKEYKPKVEEAAKDLAAIGKEQ